MFSINELYSRKDVCDILGVQKNRRGGNWLTGYTRYKGEYYVFANVNTAGKTGHNYNNYWDGDLLFWSAKTTSKASHTSIKNMTDRLHKVHVFTRTNNNDKFSYQGLGIAEKVENNEQVIVHWKFENNSEDSDGYDEIAKNEKYTEGSVKTILVNAYERSEEARRDCIKHYGYKCRVCEMDFIEKYGEIGAGFIHVHHLKQLSDISQEYVVDPINDLRPVCPNCHAIIHKRKVPYSIEEMKEIINNKI